MNIIKINLLIITLVLVSSFKSQKSVIHTYNAVEQAANAVLKRAFGQDIKGITFKQIPLSANRDVFEIEAKGGEVTISGSSPVALSRGAYQYIRANHLGMVGWAGTRLDTSMRWPDMVKTRTSTPYKHRYYLNVGALAIQPHIGIGVDGKKRLIGWRSMV